MDKQTSYRAHPGVFSPVGVSANAELSCNELRLQCAVQRLAQQNESHPLPGASGRARQCSGALTEQIKHGSFSLFLFLVPASSD